MPQKESGPRCPSCNAPDLVVHETEVWTTQYCLECFMENRIEVPNHYIDRTHIKISPRDYLKSQDKITKKKDLKWI